METVREQVVAAKEELRLAALQAVATQQVSLQAKPLLNLHLQQVSKATLQGQIATFWG